MSNTSIIDIHTHAQLKPNNASDAERQLKGIWGVFDKSPKCDCMGKQARKAVDRMEKLSQANFDKAITGNVNGVFLALGPAERNFFKPEVHNVLLKAFLPKKQYQNLAACVTGFDPEKVAKIFERIRKGEGINYYEEELVKEYEFVLSQAASASAQGKKIVIASNYTEFVQGFNQPDTITTVLTIEGAHSLGHYAEDSDFSCGIAQADDDPAIYYRVMKSFNQNIAALKQWGGDGRHTPFFVTLCHHFSNLLAGHAKSIAGGKNKVIPGMDDLLNQFPGMNEGFSRMGTEVVRALLSRENNGRRVLIDVKHMSVRSRKTFFKMLRDEYWTKGDPVPVICSHAAVNGYATMEDSIKFPDGYKKWAGGYLCRDSINLSDEEIKIIVESDGLIGIVLHGGRMPGGIAKKEIESAAEVDEAHLRVASLRLIMSNIFQIVRVINDKKVWDKICLGTDFDGIIESFELYRDFTKLPELVLHMRQFFLKPFDLPGIKMSKEEVSTLMFGYTADQLVQKIIQGNVLEFLRVYFNDGYLKNGIITKPPVV